MPKKAFDDNDEDVPLLSNGRAPNERWFARSIFTLTPRAFNRGNMVTIFKDTATKIL